MYLYKEKAVAGFTDRDTVIDKDPVTLAKFYSDNNADELLVFDLSDSDVEHEAALDLIKKICSVVEIPVIGAGNVKRAPPGMSLRRTPTPSMAAHSR